MSDDLMAKLVSPNSFDGRGPVPEKVTAAAKRIAHLRVKYVNQWNPAAEQPLTTREVQQLFDAAALSAEWGRELYEVRDGYREALERITEIDCGSRSAAFEAKDIARQALEEQSGE